MRKKNEKWIFEESQTRPYGIRELKTKSGLRELILEQIPFLEKERGEKGEESEGKKRIKLWEGLFPISYF